MNDYEIKRGTMVCENKEAIERFLELKDNGVKGYVKVKLDGKKVYVNKEALFRD